MNDVGLFFVHKVNVQDTSFRCILKFFTECITCVLIITVPFLYTNVTCLSEKKNGLYNDINCFNFRNLLTNANLFYIHMRVYIKFIVFK